MNQVDLIRLFDYDGWANGECLKSLRSATPPESAIGRMAHILSAKKLWLERLRQVPQSMAVWPGSTLEDCQALADEMVLAWREHLAGLTVEGLAEIIQYKNSKGESWESRVEDVLMHVVMHSAYHRGQIAMEMRKSGMEPAYTDFIHAVRQGALKQDSAK
ncbi:MAG: DinB family protein [Terriglobales bacterium]